MCSKKISSKTNPWKNTRQEFRVQLREPILKKYDQGRKLSVPAPYKTSLTTQIFLFQRIAEINRLFARKDSSFWNNALNTLEIMSQGKQSNQGSLKETMELLRFGQVHLKVHEVELKWSQLARLNYHGAAEISLTTHQFVDDIRLEKTKQTVLLSSTNIF